MNLSTSRLHIRELTTADAEFILRLVNTDAFKANIGDRQIHDLDAAKQKITEFYCQGYPQFGLFAVCLNSTNQAIGTVSYLKRDYLACDDIGYAFLPEYWHQGYAFEATSALLEFKLEQGVAGVWAVVNCDNQASIRLLEKLGFATTGLVVMEGEQEPILKFEYQTKTCV